ncbi:MAG TPA: metallophosphoesterase [Opitutaceae bacterium]
MCNKGPIVLILALALAGRPFVACAQDAAAAKPSPMDEVAAKLPPDVGDAARKWLHDSNKDLKAFLIFSGGDLEREVMQDLASEPEAAPFILAKLASEPPTTVAVVLKVIAYDGFWVDEPGVTEALEKLARGASDPDLMLSYMESERRLEVKRIRRALTERIAEARKSGDMKELDALAKADERWVMVERGAAMPGFMRVPAAPFTVKDASKPVRLVGMGDFGQGSSAQKAVAAEILKMGAAAPFDFGVTFGDNFYPSGMNSTEDPRWRDWWENLYGPLGITFYPSLGNHEWYSDDGAVAELLYHSPSWKFPSPYYTYTAGPVQFFAIDTTEISEAEAIWLAKAIAGSTARWKVVYGHHPIFAPEHTKKSGLYMEYMQARLWPILRGKVDAYLCGHQHAMAHMAAQEGVHFFMSGGGGGALSRVSAKTPGTVFAESNFGFLTLEADAASMKISIFDTDGKTYDSEVITK